jgi:hypothetical protein
MIAITRVECQLTNIRLNATQRRALAHGDDYDAMWNSLIVSKVGELYYKRCISQSSLQQASIGDADGKNGKKTFSASHGPNAFDADARNAQYST